MVFWSDGHSSPTLASDLCSSLQVPQFQVGVTTPDQDQRVLETWQTLKLGDWLEGHHGDVSTEEDLVKGGHSTKGGKLAEPVP